MRSNMIDDIIYITRDENLTADGKRFGGTNYFFFKLKPTILEGLLKCQLLS